MTNRSLRLILVPQVGGRPYKLLPGSTYEVTTAQRDAINAGAPGPVSVGDLLETNSAVAFSAILVTDVIHQPAPSVSEVLRDQWIRERRQNEYRGTLTDALAQDL